MRGCRSALTSKNQEVKYKTQELQSPAKSLAELTADHETSGTELSVVNEYYAEIKTGVLPARNIRGAEKVTYLGGPRPQEGALHSRARNCVCAVQCLGR